MDVLESRVDILNMLIDGFGSTVSKSFVFTIAQKMNIRTHVFRKLKGCFRKSGLRLSQQRAFECFVGYFAGFQIQTDTAVVFANTVILLTLKNRTDILVNYLKLLSNIFQLALNDLHLHCSSKLDRVNSLHNIFCLDCDMLTELARCHSELGNRSAIFGGYQFGSAAAKKFDLFRRSGNGKGEFFCQCMLELKKKGSTFDCGTVNFFQSHAGFFSLFLH